MANGVKTERKIAVLASALKLSLGANQSTVASNPKRYAVANKTIYWSIQKIE